MALHKGIDKILFYFTKSGMFFCQYGNLFVCAGESLIAHLIAKLMRLIRHLKEETGKLLV